MSAKEKLSAFGKWRRKMAVYFRNGCRRFNFWPHRAGTAWRWRDSFPFTSVYARLVFIYVVVVVVTVLILGAMLTNVFSRQYRDDLTETMLRQCERVNDILPTLSYGNEDERKYARMELQLISRESDAAIWVFERDGSKTSHIDPRNSYWQTHSSEVSMDTPFMQSVLAANQIRGYNLFIAQVDEPVMSVGSPWVYDGEVLGAIFMHARSNEIDAQMGEIMRNIVIASSAAVAMSVILISFVAHRFSQPLVTMNRVVKSYATGNFSKRVPDGGRDEIGQLAVAINNMATDLERLEEMRRSFVANVSHELKSPLASMRGFLQVIVDKVIPESEVPETLDIVLKETMRMNVLINDLLDLSKIESGDFPLQREAFDLYQLLLESVLTFEARIEDRHMDVVFDFDERNNYVFADPVRIEQVVRNLVDNAIKYAGDGVRITISCHRVVGNRAAVEIRDNGVGIPAEDVPHIWDRFYKIDKAHTPGSEGTGLGLSIVKRILDQHDSHPQVVSEVGEGTSFRFELPLAKKPVTKEKEK